MTRNEHTQQRTHQSPSTADMRIVNDRLPHMVRYPYSKYNVNETIGEMRLLHQIECFLIRFLLVENCLFGRPDADEVLHDGAQRTEVVPGHRQWGLSVVSKAANISTELNQVLHHL